MNYGGPLLVQPGQGGQQHTFQSAPVTLLVRHLPEAIPQDTLSRLFSHYGASSLRACAPAGKMRNCAFVDFQNDTLASQALLQLNRLRFLGKVLTVERAKNLENDKNNNQQHHEALQQPPPTTSLPAQPFTNNASSTVNPPHKGVAQPVAATLGVDYPFPPHLEYAYPPPDGNILTNIVNALIAVPRFYTQVLHLMNKMNIPPPFRMALPTPPLPTPTTAPPPPPPLPSGGGGAKLLLADLSSDESEMESSSEEDEIKRGRKRSRREAIVGPAVDKDVAHESVGLKSASLIPKEIPIIKKKNHVLEIKLVAKPIHTESKDDTKSMQESGETDKEELEVKPYATTEDIERGRLPPEEILSLPMFKNYAAGDPATVLYIKNLAKDVVTDDFYFIFGSLFGTVEAARSGLSVKLMQEGRMRGQAFVMFETVDVAHRALKLVNGYVFKGKPMIIQFGRNPASSGRPN
ncbi:hypothetical protein ACHQM5_018490 [Ranunculus cassubicifolius]